MARRPDAQALYQDGIRLLRSGDPEGAAVALRAAWEASPDNLECAVALGQAYAGTRTWTLAVDAWRSVLQLDAQHLRARISLADALIECGCAHEALGVLDPSSLGPAASVDAWITLGRARRAVNDLDGALSAYRSGFDLRPDDLRTVRGVATCLEALGRHNEVVTLWREVLDRTPDSTMAQRALEAATRLAADPGPQPERPARLLLDAAGERIAWAQALTRDNRNEDALSVLDEVLRQRPRLAPAARERGRVLLALQRNKPALEAFQRACLLDPRDAGAAAGQARALDELGQDVEALAAWNRAKELAPDEIRNLVSRADLLRRLTRHDDALAGYDDALRIAPHDVEALVGRATTLTALQRAAEAVQVWRRVLRIAPEHAAALRGVKKAESDAEGADDTGDRRVRGVARIHFDLGKSMLQSQRFAEAIAAFRKAAEVRRDWAEPWFYAGVAQARAADTRRAIRCFDKALERDPTHVEAACQKGDLHRQEGEHELAVGAYESALAHAPDLVHALGGRAESLRMLGRHREARADYDRALRLDPRDFVALCGLAALLTAEHRYEEARGIWERARTVRPRSPFVLKGLEMCDAIASGVLARAPTAPGEAVPPPTAATPFDRQLKARQAALDEVDRGRSFHKERDYPQAIKAFRRALELDGSFAEAALRLGLAYEDDRQFRKAISAYETCLELEPGHFQAATNIGEAHRKNELYADAIRAYDRALAMKPDYLYALAGRGECLRMLGRHDEAVDWFDRALKVGPNHAFALQGKAAALDALQRYKEALPIWTRALELEPNSAFARDGKAYCEAQLKRTDSSEPTAEGAPAESTTPTLDEQGRDLTALAAEGQLPPVIGRDKEIRAVMKTLVRRLKGNPLLLGEPGVGKTAVVEGVAQRIASGEAPARLQSLRIIELSMGSLVAGTKYRGTFEERLRELVREARATPGVVLFIDEIHTLVGAGRTEGGSLDAANILKPALARGEITIIGATTHAEYRKHLESDSALERRFQPIHVDEPSASETVELLSRMRKTYEEHHDVRVRPSALEACVRLSIRYLTDRRLPDKALDLLDEACAEASLSGAAWVDENTVATVVSERTGVPARQLTDADRTRMSGLDATLAERVVGQPDAVRTLANAVRLVKAGLRTPDRPRGVFLFRGPSGVGKTELAKALADFLFPEGGALIRLDMSEYGDRFTISRLLGAPPGYSGHGEEGQLTGPLRRKPYSVVLLDEFEKAHTDVQAVFLSLLDEGMLTDAEGHKINAREAFFIITTNAGAELRTKGRMGFGSDVVADRERALDALRSHFRPELINRFDEVVEFHALDADALRMIVQRRLGALASRASEQGVRLGWSDEVVQRLAARALAAKDGARPALRAVDTLVGEPLGRFLLSGAEAGRGWRAAVRDDQIVLEPEPVRGPLLQT